MTFSFTIPDHSLPAWEFRRTQFNTASNSNLTMEQFIQVQADDNNDKYSKALTDSRRQELARNEAMLSIHIRLQALSPEDREAKMTSIQAIMDG